MMGIFFTDIIQGYTWNQDFRPVSSLLPSVPALPPVVSKYMYTIFIQLVALGPVTESAR